MRTFGRQLSRVGRHLGLAWPVFVIFLGQRLLTVAFVQLESGDLEPLTTRWDAGWYLRLAEGGYVYPKLDPDGSVGASNLAYFPLFPWLVRQVAESGVLSWTQALLVVSWIGGLLAVWMIFGVGNALFGRATGIALAALWGMAPASLALTMGYPEGMFTAAAAAAVLALVRRRPVWAGACAIVAGLLRPSAIAVVAMVGVYFLVELGRWLAWRRSRRAEAAAAAAATADRDEPTMILTMGGGSTGTGAAEAGSTDAGSAGAGATGGAATGEEDPGADRAVEERAADPDRPRPLRAFLGAVLSTLGLGAFMVYVGMRTGETFGYFTVQAQWGQETAGFVEYWQGIAEGLLGSGPASLIPVTLVVSLGYVLLFCLIVFDRRLVPATVYAAGLLLISLTHVTFQHVYARQLLPAFVLLIPLVRMPVPRAGAAAALVVGSVAVSWGSAQFLLDPGAAM